MDDDIQTRTRHLPHPEIDDLALVDVLRALADPVRLEIVRKLYRAGGKVNCISSVGAMACLSKSTLSHHFRILRECGLVRSERQGVELLNCLRLTELEARFPGVLTSILQAGRCSSASPLSSVDMQS
jgi:DNA-binding transcriptional ArsR family regulator